MKSNFPDLNSDIFVSEIYKMVCLCARITHILCYTYVHVLPLFLLIAGLALIA